MGRTKRSRTMHSVQIERCCKVKLASSSGSPINGLVADWHPDPSAANSNQTQVFEMIGRSSGI
jgi:hypothetical protein